MALFLASGTAVVMAIASILAGFPSEIAIVRGVLAFMAISFVGYLGELVVVTAPPPARLSRQDEADAAGPGERLDEGTERRVE